MQTQTPPSRPSAAIWAGIACLIAGYVLSQFYQIGRAHV